MAICASTGSRCRASSTASASRSIRTTTRTTMTTPTLMGDATEEPVPGRDPGYPADQRGAVYRVIAERRDVRQGFRPDPVPAEVLGRVLAAAHQAPSVGFSQPWDFIVITDRARRERVAALAGRRRDEVAAGPD